MRACPNCGRDVISGSNFCAYCSYTLSGLARPRTSKRNHERNIALTIASLTLIGMIAIPALLFNFIPFPVVVSAGGSSDRNSFRIDSAWVSQFVRQVDAARIARGDSALQPAQSLSDFAATRLGEMSQHYEIPGYTSYNDTAVFFDSKADVNEHTFTPEGYNATGFFNFLRGNSTSFWSPLTQGNLGYYGFAVAPAPTFVITNLCTVGLGFKGVANESEYLTASGCTFQVKNSTWLVLELAQAPPRYSVGDISLVTSNPLWTDQFIGAVNAARQANGAQPLEKNQILEDFANLRFEHASSHYWVLNYGFYVDVYNLSHGRVPPFPPVSETVFQVGLIPNGTEFAAKEQANPTIWARLMNPLDRTYGIYLGTAPYYHIANNCDSTGTPELIANETEFLISRGCSFSLVNHPWLVIEISS